MENLKAKVLLEAAARAPNGLWVEIGCIREDHEVPQDGFSTFHLAKTAQKRGCRFITIDKGQACTAIATKILSEHELSGEVILGDGKDEVKKLGPISFLYLDSHRLPIFSAEQFREAELVPGAIVVIDDCHAFDNMAYGKGDILIRVFNANGIKWEIKDTEPGFRMVIAKFPLGKIAGSAK
jgi:predicted O-methyltransferase YrrM